MVMKQIQNFFMIEFLDNIVIYETFFNIIKARYNINLKKRHKVFPHQEQGNVIHPLQFHSIMIEVLAIKIRH